MGPFFDRRLGRNMDSRFFSAQNSSRSENSIPAIAGCVYAIAGWPKSVKIASYFIKKAQDVFSSKPAIAGCVHAIAGAPFLLLDV